MYELHDKSAFWKLRLERASHARLNVAWERAQACECVLRFPRCWSLLYVMFFMSGGFMLRTLELWRLGTFGITADPTSARGQWTLETGPGIVFKHRLSVHCVKTNRAQTTLTWCVTSNPLIPLSVFSPCSCLCFVLKSFFFYHAFMYKINDLVWVFIPPVFGSSFNL